MRLVDMHYGFPFTRDLGRDSRISRLHGARVEDPTDEAGGVHGIFDIAPLDALDVSRPGEDASVEQHALLVGQQHAAGRKHAVGVHDEAELDEHPVQPVDDRVSATPIVRKTAKTTVEDA